MRKKKCEHNRERAKCKECKALGIGGNQICEHDKRRDKCKECKALGIGGSNVCEHGSRQCLICKPEGAFKQYVRNATERGFSFELTVDEFKTLIAQPCLFCGEREKPRGIDRWDNKIGYVLENCRPCCSTCNRMKGAMGGGTWVEHCQRIADHTITVESEGVENAV